MEIATLREEVMTRVEKLSVDDLKIVNAFIAFLEAGANLNTESAITPTEADKSVIENFKQSWLEAQSGWVHPIQELEWS